MKMLLIVRASLYALITIGAFVPTAFAEQKNAANWPGFLGAGVDAEPSEGVPLKWSPEENIAWQAELVGYGQSSPVVWDGQVYLTTVDGPKKGRFLLTSFALDTGELQWQRGIESKLEVENSVYTSRAAPTPVVDSAGVYCFFENGTVAAWNHEGKALWQRSLTEQYGPFENEFGLSASPVQLEDRMVVLVDHKGPSYLVALSKRDGSVMWHTERDSRISWSSPAIVSVDGSPQIVCSSAGSVDGYDPQTGAKLWSYDQVGGNTAATPLSFGEGAVLIAASPGRGGENAAEAKKSNLALKIDRKGDEFQTEVLWRTAKATPSFASPMVHKEHAYWINRVGVVFCLDATSGELKYSQRIKQSCWATPLGIGDRIYFVGKEGITTVLATGPEYQVLAENMLWDPEAVSIDKSAVERETEPRRRQAAAMFAKPTQYAVAAVGNTLLIRSGRKLFALRGQ